MNKTDVLKHFKTQARVASALTEAGHPISQAAVCKWPEEIPEKRAYQLERITGGVLKAFNGSSTQPSAA